MFCVTGYKARRCLRQVLEMLIWLVSLGTGAAAAFARAWSSPGAESPAATMQQLALCL